MKETFYFSHDYNARNDERMIKLRRKLGYKGYGIFWGLIEILAESSTHKLKLGDIEDFAFEMREEVQDVSSVISDFGLFKTGHEYFYSERLMNHFYERNLKSEKARKSAKKRWNNANAMRTQCAPNAIKESKGKERKGNNILPKGNRSEAPTAFGKENINSFMEDIKKITGRPPVSGKQSRNYASNFLKKLKKEYPEQDENVLASKILTIAMELQDGWHTTKCHDPKHLFYNWQEITAKKLIPKKNTPSFGGTVDLSAS